MNENYEGCKLCNQKPVFEEYPSCLYPDRYNDLKSSYCLYQVVMMTSEPEQIAMEESFFGLQAKVNPIFITQTTARIAGES